MGRRLGLVACAAGKHDAPLPAAELYRSALFTKARRYAEQHTDAWWILSAKHGLLNPWSITTPYNQSLNSMPCPARRAWAQSVHQALRPQLMAGDSVLFLAGAKYRVDLEALLRQDGVETAAPMARLSIGMQLQWLDAHARPEPVMG